MFSPHAQLKTFKHLNVKGNLVLRNSVLGGLNMAFVDLTCFVFGITLAAQGLIQSFFRNLMFATITLALLQGISVTNGRNADSLSQTVSSSSHFPAPNVSCKLQSY